MKNSLTANTNTVYMVRNNLHKFIKRMRNRLYVIFQNESLRDDQAFDMMDEIRKVYDHIVTEYTAVYEHNINEVSFMAEITDETEFANAFYEYLINGVQDGFKREYNAFLLTMALDLAYDC